MSNDVPFTEKEVKQPISKKDFLYTLALLLITTIVFGFYLRLATQNHFSQLEPLVNGTAPRPYVYRALAPFLVKTLSEITHVSLFSAAVIVMYLSIVGFSLTMLALGKIFLARPYIHPFTLLAPIGLLPFLFEARHIYDFPNLFLFALALYFLAGDRFGRYLLVFVACAFSKETSLLLLLFFAVQFRSLARKKYLRLILAQLGIYVGVRFLLIELFKRNPGSVLEFHLLDQVNAFAEHPILFTSFLIVLGVLGWLAVKPGALGDSFLRNFLVIIGIPLFILFLFFGMPYEVRVFMEIYPSLFLLVSQSAIRLLENHAKQRPSST
jgi:hypothetical protein